MDKITIGNELFRTEYDKEDNKQTIDKVLGFYSRQIPNPDLNQLGALGLWNCLKKHDYSNKNKFTSSLWRFVKWECQKFLRSKNRDKRYVYGIIEIDKRKDDYKNKRILAEEALNCISSKEDRELIESYFIYKKSYSEIATEHNLSKEFVRKKILKTVSILKEKILC